MNPFFLFSGTSNPDLADAVASKLDIETGDIDITRFIDNECRVQVKEDVTDKHVFVLQSLSQIADQHLVELCLIGNALQSLGASKITAVIPWMGYSKQDRAFRRGEAVSAQLVAKFIESAGFTGVVTLELHSENVVQFFHIPVHELSTQQILHDAFVKAGGLDDPKTTIVVSPDSGGKTRSGKFANSYGLPIVYLSKERDQVTGSVTVTRLSDSVSGKTVVIFDDIINTGATAIKASNFLHVNGADTIYFLATHPVLAGRAAADLDLSDIDQIIVTDTVSVPREKYIPKLSVVSVAPLLADAIKSNL